MDDARIGHDGKGYGAPMKSGTPQKIKFLRLKRALKLSHWQAVGLLESLWLSTYANAPNGDIGRLSNDDIASSIEYEDDANSLIDVLVDCGWVERDPEFRLFIHDWSEHCATGHKGNQIRYGKRFADEIAHSRPKEPRKDNPSEPIYESRKEPPCESPSNHTIPTIPKEKQASACQKKTPFEKPTVEDVRSYCMERSNAVDAEKFVDHYTSNGWMVGKSPMRDWKASVRTWEKQDGKKPEQRKSRVPTAEELANWNPVDGGLSE